MFGIGKRKSKRSTKSERGGRSQAGQRETVLYEEDEDVEIVYVDEDGNPVDADGNPLEGEDVEIIYVDEDGNEISPDESVEYVYVDEDGNPVMGDADDEVVYVDEDGNYTDAQGRPVAFSDDDEEVEVVYVDEDGNEVDHDEQGNPVEDEDVEIVYVDADGNPVDADGNPLEGEGAASTASGFAEAAEDDDSAEYEAAREAIQADFQKHVKALERAHAAGALDATTFAAQMKAEGKACEDRLAELDGQYEVIEVAEGGSGPSENSADKAQIRRTVEDMKVVVKEGAETLREVKSTVEEFKELTDFKSWLK